MRDSASLLEVVGMRPSRSRSRRRSRRRSRLRTLPLPRCIWVASVLVLRSDGLSASSGSRSTCRTARLGSHLLRSPPLRVSVAAVGVTARCLFVSSLLTAEDLASLIAIVDRDWLEVGSFLHGRRISRLDGLSRC